MPPAWALWPLAALLLSARASALSWAPLACPSRGAPLASCSQPVVSASTDAALALFFQVESTASGGAFSCGDAEVVFCARSWTLPEAGGAAGSCFFILPAGRTFACTATSGINVIDANYALLAQRVLGAPAALACPAGTLGGSADAAGCEQPPLPHDAWVLASFRGAQPSGGSAFSCAAGGVTLCSFATSLAGPADASSCSFLLAAHTPLACAATAGAVTFSAPATAFPLSIPYAGNASSADSSIAPCPPAGPKPNDCDCAVDLAHNATDALVTITSTVPDGSFNSFHCGMNGVNVCGWGSNSGMNGTAATCAFLLPAGESYDCEMEWGAVTFSASSVTSARAALFAPAAAAAASPPRRWRRAALPAPAGPATADGARLARLWSAWKAEHARAYDGEEDARCFAHFQAHVAAADAAAPSLVDAPHLDARGLPTRFNAFADTPRAAWEARFRGRAAAPPAALRATARAASAALPPPPSPPPALDWRGKGVVTAVKDQGQCGSCWSFSTTGAAESAWAVAGNALTSLSEQLLVSCDTTSDGCGGGFPNTAFDWLSAHGADTEASYPYVSGDGSTRACNETGRVRAEVNVTGWRLVPGNTSATEAALAAWLAAYGPVSILVDAMTQLWWPYTGGVMTACCDVSTDHAVLLVGYNFSAAPPYWIIKNSWGAAWGEGGYLRLAAGSNECGIGTFPVIPTVAGGVLPPPPPPPPPRPLWQCPPDAHSVNTSTTASCVWTNGTSATWRMPTSGVEGDCTYLSQGYLGYTFPGSDAQGAYPCPPSFSPAGDGGEAWFCMLEKGQNGFVDFPPGVTALCDDVAAGVIGYAWPR